MDIRIGTSGWNYPHWRKLFYPERMPQSKWLNFYAGRFTSVELNASFYRQPTRENFENWRKKTPPDFLWSVKANRYITHIKKLRDTRDSLEIFYRAVEGLSKKLGVVLFQLPPSLRFDEKIFADFLDAQPPGYKITFEFRHASWLCEEVYKLLHRKNAAFCISDTAGRYPYAEVITADFIYIRLHGSQVLYGSNYTEDELTTWAAKIKGWQKDVFVYFDNDYQGYAVQNALRLKEMVSGH
ncbi:MAG: DUF72 domain-containing protein [Deltaproteobacteria bacterium]|nr:MAG: DUF72 domain-containing protein [Deltaproteobacteria bacterium]